MTERDAINVMKWYSEEEYGKGLVSESHRMAIKALEKQIPSEPLNRGGIPEMGYCPDCGEAVTKSANPVCCKWCMKRLDWKEV